MIRYAYENKRLERIQDLMRKDMITQHQGENESRYAYSNDIDLPKAERSVNVELRVTKPCANDQAALVHAKEYAKLTGSRFFLHWG